MEKPKQNASNPIRWTDRGIKLYLPFVMNIMSTVFQITTATLQVILLCLHGKINSVVHCQQQPTNDDITVKL